MTNDKSHLWKLTLLTTFFVVIVASAFGQRRECPLEKYDGNWAFGTTQTFYVGDPFDGIGQIEVMRPGKKVQIHEKNRKWKLDGVRIKPGEVFTKPGKFTMTMESSGFETAYRVEVLPAKGPKRPVATVVSYPIQTTYKVGDRFFVDGIKVVCHEANGKELPVERKDITFFTSISNTLIGVGSQCGGGYKFSSAGKKEVEVRYKYVTIGKFSIIVGNGKSASASTPASATVSAKPLTNGWYNFRIMNNYINLTAAGDAELRNKSSNQTYYVETKGNSQITLKMANGKYLGVTGGIKNGVRVKAVSAPYTWKVYSENKTDTYSIRPSSNTKMVLNASGEKKINGTPIILWTHTNLNAPNHAEIRFIPKSKP